MGYTTNISMTGMFIATNSPMAGGSRIRIEVNADRDRGFMVEGVVAHARKVRGELMRVTQSGMGVRFLTVEELVRELFPAALMPTGTEEIPQASTPPDTIEPVPELEMPELEMPEPIPEPSSFFDSFPDPVRPPSPPPTSPPPSPLLTRPAPRPVGEGAFSIHFASTDEFLEVYRRDILQGGLFVSTLHPARIQEAVMVELHPPLPGADPILVRARVVQRFDPHSGDSSGGLNLLAGMGLELIDLPALVERLQPIVHRLRG